eukprot:a843646_146.p2 GENE.a843646_146~~a843646_146.p2  ORF type:complete len:369 (+),score=77.98 a843646_146:39-1109(+)
MSTLSSKFNAPNRGETPTGLPQDAAKPAALRPAAMALGPHATQVFRVSAAGHGDAETTVSDSESLDSVLIRPTTRPQKRNIDAVLSDDDDEDDERQVQPPRKASRALADQALFEAPRWEDLLKRMMKRVGAANKRAAHVFEPVDFALVKRVQKKAHNFATMVVFMRIMRGDAYLDDMTPADVAEYVADAAFPDSEKEQSLVREFLTADKIRGIARSKRCFVVRKAARGARELLARMRYERSADYVCELVSAHFAAIGDGIVQGMYSIKSVREAVAHDMDWRPSQRGTFSQFLEAFPVASHCALLAIATTLACTIRKKCAGPVIYARLQDASGVLDSQLNLDGINGIVRAYLGDGPA